MRKIYYSTSVVNLLDVVKGSATSNKIVVINKTGNELCLVCRSYTVANANYSDNADDIKKEFVINIPSNNELHWVQSNEDATVKTFSIASKGVKGITLENGEMIEAPQINLNNCHFKYDDKLDCEVIANRGQVYKVTQEPYAEQNSLTASFPCIINVLNLVDANKLILH